MTDSVGYIGIAIPDLQMRHSKFGNYVFTGNYQYAIEMKATF